MDRLKLEYLKEMGSATVFLKKDRPIIESIGRDGPQLSHLRGPLLKLSVGAQFPSSSLQTATPQLTFEKWY